MQIHGQDDVYSQLEHTFAIYGPWSVGVFEPAADRTSPECISERNYEFKVKLRVTATRLGVVTPICVHCAEYRIVLEDELVVEGPRHPERHGSVVGASWLSACPYG